MDEPTAAPESQRRSARTPIVFATDASPEASHAVERLRRAGYEVVDVALDALVDRAMNDRPNVVLVDADASGALDEVSRLRKLPGSGAIDFVYFGNGEGRIKSADDAFANEGSAFFLRPVDLAALVRRVEALTGGPLVREARSSSPPSPPPMVPLSVRRPSSAPPDRPSAPSLPAPGLRQQGPPLPMSVPSLVDLVDPPRSLSTFGAVSSELQQLLAEAELRAEVQAAPEAPMPSPEEEIEAVLPADILASLDEPIDRIDDEDPEPNPRGSALPERDGPFAPARGTTSGGSKQTTTGSSRIATPHHASDRRASELPPFVGDALSGAPANAFANDRSDRALAPESSRVSIQRRTAPSPMFPRAHDLGTSRTPSVHGMTPEPPFATASHGASPNTSATTSRETTSEPPPSGRQGTPVYVTRHASREETPFAPVVAPSRPPEFAPVVIEELRGPSVEPPSDPALAAVVLGPGDARRFFADAIATRQSGSICFEQHRIVRRIVLRDGDLVTAASGDERESLVHFLGARGELPRHELDRLAVRIPPYGRHAGAALVAHGYLRQDQLWTVLRAHSEWIAGAVLSLGSGTAQLEREPPGRLRGEPSVFGAATGAEIFVELVRRTVSPEEALEQLGGAESRVADGPNQGLLGECALGPHELDLVGRARGGMIADLLARAPDGEIASVLHALALLGIVEIVPAIGGPRARDREAADREVAALDEEALRARIRARAELVEEGDYFAILGVTREATSYEVKRAFVELRRTFEPSRVLTPRLLDLEEDVRKIVIVLEEAYEILRDGARRERYRRAIDARP